jgi:hypothetical protein
MPPSDDCKSLIAHYLARRSAGVSLGLALLAVTTPQPNAQATPSFAERLSTIRSLLSELAEGVEGEQLFAQPQLTARVLPFSSFASAQLFRSFQSTFSSFCSFHNNTK